MTDKKSNDAYDQVRLRYWNNNYVQYWKARVAEANTAQSGASAMVAGDAATTGDIRYLQAIDLLGINPQHSVLELGCGFGRSLPVLSRLGVEVSAVDISEQMIEAAKREFASANISFHVSPSEDLPFENDKFDRIVCFAAFDAMFQTEALAEMHRVCKTGGRILLTGKNDNYPLDDRKAYDAELGARDKGHPNYFTDMKKLMDDLERFGLAVDSAKYFEHRGDFADGIEKAEMPSYFYEYLLVLEKTGPCAPAFETSYYSAISKTCARLQQSAPTSGDDHV
jgi:ubiquinone/menaquinone biosynthesis C-methylase UbiE